MAESDSLAECSADIVVGFAGSLCIFPGLLAVAVSFGALLGCVLVALLYVYFMKPEMFTRTLEAYHSRRFFETDKLEKDDKSECASTGRKACQPNKKPQARKLPPADSEVTAFALKAKVVYPINQRYRPLADGASNPSLHENPKLANLHTQESPSSSSLESLSQDNEDDDSSQFVSTSPIPRTFQNESFIQVSCFPETLGYVGYEGRISLYCLGLQRLQFLLTSLQEDKHVTFLHILKIIFNERFDQEKTDSAFYSNVLLVQEKELEELKKEASMKLLRAERGEDADSGFSTLEEMERAGRDRHEQELQMAIGFSQQQERLCQRLLGRPGIPHKNKVWDMMRSLLCCQLLVECKLGAVQNWHLKNLQEKLLWWEELIGGLQTRPVLLKHQLVCCLRLVAKALEKLTSDGRLGFGLMEEMLAELRDKMKEELQRCSEDCLKLTRELLSEKVKRAETKCKKLAKAHTKERSRFLDSSYQYRDPQDFVKSYQELLDKQWKERGDLEEHQDGSMAEAVCELWKSHYCSCSEKLADRVQDFYLVTLPGQSALPTGSCEDLTQEAKTQLQFVGVCRQYMEGVQEQLEQDRQSWSEEEALVRASLSHLVEQHMKIFRGMLIRLSMRESSTINALMEEKQHLLLLTEQRHFLARHFSLRMLKEMRLSRLKMTSLEDTCGLKVEDFNKVQQSPHRGHKDSGTNDRLGADIQMIGQGFQQEFLSEIDTGTEMIQEHAQLLVGHALAQIIWQEVDVKSVPKTQSEGDHTWKMELAEDASESVYVTRDSINTLIHNYYIQIQSIIKTLRHGQRQRLQSIEEENRRLRARNKLSWSLQKELVNWERKPTSREFYERVEVLKKKLPGQYDLDLEDAYEVLRRKKSVLNYVKDRIEREFQVNSIGMMNDVTLFWLMYLCKTLGFSPKKEPEEAFLSQLAALSRIPLSSRRTCNSTSKAEMNIGEGQSPWLSRTESIHKVTGSFRYNQGKL